MVIIKIWSNVKPDHGMKLVDDLGRKWIIKSITTHAIPSFEFFERQKEGIWDVGIAPVDHTMEIEMGVYELLE